MSKPDPIGDLFGSPQPPAPVVVSPTTTPKATGGGWSGLVLALALFGGLWYAESVGWLDRFKGDKGDRGDKQEQVEPVAGVKPGWLIVLSERQDPSMDEANKVDAVAKFCDAQKAAGMDIEFRNPDKDDKTDAVVKLVEFAKSKGVSPPCVVYKLKTGNVLKNAIALPSTDSELKKVFK